MSGDDSDTFLGSFIGTSPGSLLGGPTLIRGPFGVSTVWECWELPSLLHGEVHGGLLVATLVVCGHDILPMTIDRRSSIAAALTV